MDVNGAIAGVDVIFLSIPLPAMAELSIGFLKTLPEEGGRCRYQRLLSWNARSDRVNVLGVNACPEIRQVRGR